MKMAGSKPLYLLVLIAVCAGAFLLALPTMKSNIEDPNMIAYMNSDEGGAMDLIWYYYSGQKRASFQWDYDYGLELRYIADIARVIPKGIVAFTPGTLVLIIRWINLIAWIAAIAALWYFVGYHFGRGWKQAVAVLLLFTRPAYSYFLNNTKPEPLVLLVMIMGLHYILRLVEKPSWRHLIIAVTLAVTAFLIKYAGIFLLPAIVAAMYLSEARRGASHKEGSVFRDIKAAPAFPALAGAMMIAMLYSAIIFYVRKSTGHTWYEDYGFWGSIQKSRPMACLFLASCVSIISSIALILVRIRFSETGAVVRFLNRMTSYIFIVGMLFLLILPVIGFRWVITPGYFLTTYSQVPSSAYKTEMLQAMGDKGPLVAFLGNMLDKISALDPLVLAVFLLYLAVELSLWKRNFAKDRLNLFKRVTLCVFLLCPLTLVFSGMRFQQHHMLPFFCVMSVLGLAGLEMLSSDERRASLSRKVIPVFAGILLMADIVRNGTVMAKARFYDFQRNEDVAYDIRKWWPDNIPKDAVIVSDHYVRVYIPDGYNSVKTLSWGAAERAGEFRRLVESCRPRYIYIGRVPSQRGAMPEIARLLPDRRVGLVKTFESSGRRYQTYEGGTFYIYELL